MAKRKTVPLANSKHSIPLLALMTIENMTGSELAATLRVPLPLLQQIERGEIDCPLSVHDRLEQRFGTRFDSHLRSTSHIDP